MSKKSEKDDESGRNYIVSALMGAFWIWIVNMFWPGTIPFETFSFWHTQTTLGDWLSAGTPIFLWGVFLSTAMEVKTTIQRANTDILDRIFAPAELHPLKIFFRGLIISTWAGFMEEICFRWLIFLSAIIGAKVVNFLLFGFLGFGIPEWLHLHLFGPLADWTTFGRLHVRLFSSTTWAVGAAMLSANAFFRDGHKYQGLLGYVNSWFGGMFFFWMLFNYGLPGAITTHLVYDVICFTVGAIGAALRRRS